jgi:hypothetical protein
MENKQTAVIEGTNYSICIDGTLINMSNGKIKKWTKDTNGYIKAQIWVNNSPINITQHRILAECFIDNIGKKPQVNHINGVKSDNRIENLEWVTQSENAIHSFKNGLQKPKGPNKKVIDVVTGRVFESVTLASKYIGVSRSHLSNMLIGRVTNSSNLRFYGK